MSASLLKPLGRAIRAKRSAAGFSQESFADHIAMHRTYYSAIERGEKNIQLDTLRRVAQGLGVPVWEILKGAEEGAPMPG